jgi:hypothetical protein
VPAGEDPGGDCTPDAQGSCGRDGTCNGNGACRLEVAGTRCGAAACNGDALLTERTCDGAGICRAGESQSCGAYVCEAGACRADCDDTAECASPNLCVNRQCVSSLTQGLVGHWNLNECTGTTGNDRSGRGNHATFRNGATWAQESFPADRTGASCAALCDGMDDWIELGTSGMPRNQAARAISLWYRSDTAMPKSTGTIASVSATEGAINGDTMYWSSGGTRYASAPVPAAGAWHHLVFSYDGATNELWIDGSLAAISMTLPEPLNPVSYRLCTWPWGAGGDNSFSAYRGVIDEVRIYDRGLAGAEVARLFAGLE